MIQALIIALLAVAHAQSPQILDFEDLAVGSGVHRQYYGVTFHDGDAQPPEVRIAVPTAGALSGRQGLEGVRRGEFAGSGIRMSFDRGQQRVKMSVGLNDSGADHQGLLAVLHGFDTTTPSAAQQANPVATSRIVTLGTPPQAVDVPLEIGSAAGDLVRVDLVVLAHNWESVVPPSPDQVDVVIDNLEYDAPDEPRTPDTRPPAITVEHPVEGATVNSRAPGDLETFVVGEVVEQSLAEVTLQLNGRPAVGVGHDGNVGGRYRFLGTLFESTGLVDGANEVVLRAVDAEGNASTLTRRFTYAMEAVPAPTDVDIRPIGVELNQAISPGPFGLTPDGDGYSLQVPDWADLVQDTDTLVRVYAVAVGASAPIDDVPARMEVFRDDCTGSDCRLGFLQSRSSATRLRAAIRVPAAGSEAATLTAMAQELDDTWNFLIPAAWATGPLRIFVDLDPPQECVADFIGECERDNHITIHADFAPQHVATVEPVLVRFLGTFAGNEIDEAPRTTDVATVLEGLNTLYPTRFDLGPTHTITVDPNISGEDLLAKVQRRFGCQAPDILSPSSWWACGFDPSVFRIALVTNTFDLGAGGMANRGNNTMWAQVGRTTPSHEAGHAIGFMHATCDHDEADGGDCDSYYPGLHGRLDGIGFDPRAWSLRVDNSAGHAHDFMSYGARRWVSRYTWRITADHPYVGNVDYDWCFDLTGPYRCGSSQADTARRGGGGAPEGPVLLVYATLDADGSATFEDAYRRDRGGVPPVPRAGAPLHRLEALDGQGNTLVVVPVEASDTLGPATPGASVIAEVPLPSRADVSTLQLRDPDGVVVGVLHARAARAPDIAIASIGAPGPWDRSEVREISWTIGAQGTAQVELHAEGRPVQVLGTQLTGTTLDVVVGELPATPSARIAIRASDGVHTSVTTSASFEIPPGDPTALIVSPEGDIEVEQGMALSLHGLGADDTSPLPDDALTWTSPTLGDIGQGSRAVLDDLPLGEHLVTLTAVSEGGSSSTSFRVTVVNSALSPGGGCGCDTPGPTSWGWLALLGAGLLRRRRA